MFDHSINKACRNCSKPLDGVFCNECGQRDLGEKITFKSIIAISIEPLFEWDHKLWRSLKDLTLNPGKVAAEYVSGKRIIYVNPIKYCIAALAVGAAISVMTGEFEALQRSASDAMGDYATTGAETAAGARAKKFIFANANIVHFLALPLLAWVMKGLYRSSGRTFLETLCFIFFVFGHVAVLGVALTLINVYTFFASFWPSQLLLLGYLLWGSHVFFDAGYWGALLKTLLIMASQFLIVAVVSNIVFFLYIHISA